MGEPVISTVYKKSSVYLGCCFLPIRVQEVFRILLEREELHLCYVPINCQSRFKGPQQVFELSFVSARARAQCTRTVLETMRGEHELPFCVVEVNGADIACSP